MSPGPHATKLPSRRIINTNSRGRSVTMYLCAWNVLLMICSLIQSGTAHAAPSHPTDGQLPRLAVLDFKDEAQLPQFELASLADSVRGAALNAPFMVMTKENMITLLPPGTELESCVGECEVEVGRKIGAHYLITGQIGSIDGQLQLLLRLYETKGGSLRGQSTITAYSVGVMQPKVRRAATELLTRISP